LFIQKRRWAVTVAKFCILYTCFGVTIFSLIDVFAKIESSSSYAGINSFLHQMFLGQIIFVSFITEKLIKIF